MNLSKVICRHTQITDLEPLKDHQHIKINAKNTGLTKEYVEEFLKDRPKIRVELGN